MSRILPFRSLAALKCTRPAPILCHPFSVSLPSRQGELARSSPPSPLETSLISFPLFSLALSQATLSPAPFLEPVAINPSKKYEGDNEQLHEYGQVSPPSKGERQRGRSGASSPSFVLSSSFPPLSLLPATVPARVSSKVHLSVLRLQGRALPLRLPLGCHPCLALPTRSSAGLLQERHGHHSSRLPREEHEVRGQSRVIPLCGLALARAALGGERFRAHTPPSCLPQVVYNFLSYQNASRIRLKTYADEITPVPSLVGLFRGADCELASFPCSTDATKASHRSRLSTAAGFEREVWDMFGILFTGHPDLRRFVGAARLCCRPSALLVLPQLASRLVDADLHSASPAESSPTTLSRGIR